MKRKELFKRLTAVSMSAMMAVTMVPTTAFASEDDFFADSLAVTEDGEASDENVAEDFGAAQETEEDGFGSGEDFTAEEETEELSGFLDEGAEEEGKEETTAVADAEVSLTIGQNGVPALAKDGSAMISRTVTVTDINKDGKLTYEEALIAAHDAYYDDGAAAGFASEDSQYGLALKKLWGDASGAFGYWDNEKSCFNLSDQVADGDELTAFVYKDQTGWSDAYTKFENSSYIISAKTPWTPSLEKAVYSSEAGGYVFEECKGVKLVAYDGSRKPLSADLYTVDGESVTFAETGTYYVVAEGTDSAALVPTAAKVFVVAGTQSGDVEKPDPTGISLGKEQVIIPVGYKLTLKPTMEPADCKDVELTWKSSNPEVATVEDGAITGVSIGETTITVSTGNLSAECKVIITKRPTFSSLKFYTTAAAYDSGAEPLKMTPAFTSEGYDYVVTAPDYVSSLYTEGILDSDALKNGYTMVMVPNGWGWTGNKASNGILLKNCVVKDNAFSLYINFGHSYNVTVERYTTLQKLVIDGIVSQAFDKDVTSYHAYVDGTASGVSITSTALDAAYAITINGESVKSGEAFNLPYKWDENGKMEVAIEVKQDGFKTSTYTVELEKEPLNAAPFVLTQPAGADYIEGAKTSPLTVSASADGEMTYQWYVNDKDDTEGGKLIDGATEASYTPSSAEVGTLYYYCVITNKDKAENNTTTTNTACVVVDPDPTPVATLDNPGEVMPDDGYAYKWSKGYVYKVDEEATPLKVTATSKAEGGTFTYQWYKSTSATGTGGMVLQNTNSDTYVPQNTQNLANTAGNYYSCKITYTFKGKSYTAFATTGETDNGKNVTGVYVFTKVTEAATPTFTKQPVSASYFVGDAMTALSVSAGRADGGTIKYQWYENDTDSTENGTAITTATSSTYKIGTAAEAGTKYYYCVVTNTNQGYTATATSEIAKITIRTPESVISQKLKGAGTEEDPYQIRTAEDYISVRDLVAQGITFKGVYLRQERNITLPAGWTPIGVTKDGTNNIKSGANLNPFSGTLDGNGKTITIPVGGLPLLGYVKEATVRNLNIYGKKIAGYGLVNNFEGVGLSGSAIVIDNVTLKSGSSTLKSGFIGANITTNGFAGCSNGFVATIENCTIEAGVIIGYDKDQTMIGSFAGRMQGSVINCVSHATVYGKGYVGGIIGTRDNAMGNCSVTGCQFDGTVEASGEHAGGIAGGGYTNSTAPNGIRIGINDCSSTGTIIGKDKVGGILGGDTYVTQAWNAYTFRGNSFDGTVKATDGNYVGGVIGFYKSLDVNDGISHNHYSANCGATKGIGAVDIVDTDCETHETASGAQYVNTEKYHRSDDPLGADAERLTTTKDISEPYVVKLDISGDYKTDFYMNEDLDLTGMTIKATYDDGTEKDVALSDLNITGYDNTKHGNQTLTLEYGGEKVKIEIRVLRKGDDIKVSFQLLGDSKHGESKTPHTLQDNNLTGWVPATDYTVDTNATVFEVMQVAAEEYGFKILSRDTIYGTYVYGIEYKGVKLEEFDNGNNSGWMYTLNGDHPDVGVAAQYLNDGDVIVFHYTDDYTREDADKKAAEAVTEAVKGLPETEALTLADQEAVVAARKAYDELNDTQKEMISSETLEKLTAAEAKIKELVQAACDHVFDEGKVTKEATCKEAGEKLYICTVCGFEKTEELPKTENHTFDEGKVTKEATCKEAGEKVYTCTICGFEKKEELPKTENHIFDEGKVTKEATYTEAGEKVYTCTVCGFQKTEVIPVIPHTHDFTWKVVSEATVFQPEKVEGTCTICGAKEERENGTALKATIKLNVKSITLQKKQTTKKIKVTMANGDSVVSWKSSNKKIVTVDKNGVIKAGNKKGTAKITVTLKSGKTATLNVKVQTAKVATKKISGLDKTVFVKKGKTLKLTPVISPITSQDKVTYTSSNKKVATVTKKGVIKGIKKGTAKITVKSGNKKFTVTVKVKNK